MIIYRNIEMIDETTLRVFCSGIGTSDAEMYAFSRSYAILQLKHWKTGYRYFPEDKEYRKICIRAFLRNIYMMNFYKRGYRV